MAILNNLIAEFKKDQGIDLSNDRLAVQRLREVGSAGGACPCLCLERRWKCGLARLCTQKGVHAVAGMLLLISKVDGLSHGEEVTHNNSTQVTRTTSYWVLRGAEGQRTRAACPQQCGWHTPLMTLVPPAPGQADHLPTTAG